MQEKGIDKYYATSRKEWREWLENNHHTEQSIWLIQKKKGSQQPTISWSESVDEALCFGWIDSTRKSVDSETFMQFFGKRKPKSVWSKINKAKVEQLIADGLMAQAGLDSIEIAKQNGSWSILDDVEELMIPKDLEESFASQSGSKDFFLSLSKSVRKAILQWVVLAKRADTRQKRISEVVESAGHGRKPRQF
jgi:uncharacterized protein YdeI (YjbR/CyaY-like superfamily)